MPSPRGKVLVAMSGGVDSSVAAAMLVRDGYDVVGCFMRLGSPGETLDELIPAEVACSAPANRRPAKIGHQGCCSITDAADARLVAAHLGIPFYVCNFKKDFGRIIDYFVDEYAQGRTPNPCVRCNDWLKFGKLHEYASQIGADFIASGHYARTEAAPVTARLPSSDAGSISGSSATIRLRRGLDHSKDQSYVLFGVPRTQLPRLMFPLGGLHKSEVRTLAQQFGLDVFDKPDSQEICFVPDNDYAGLVESRRPELARSGRIVDSSGRVLGTHDGQHRYTIGQRRGVGVAFGYPIYVVGKDPETNTITVGDREALQSTACRATEANWLIPEDDLRVGAFPCLAKYRYNSPPVPATARLIDDSTAETPSGRRGQFEVQFDSPQFAVAPGQAVVLYDAQDPDTILGGGWIASTT